MQFAQGHTAGQWQRQDQIPNPVQCPVPWTMLTLCIWQLSRDNIVRTFVLPILPFEVPLYSEHCLLSVPVLFCTPGWGAALQHAHSWPCSCIALSTVWGSFHQLPRVDWFKDCTLFCEIWFIKSFTLLVTPAHAQSGTIWVLLSFLPLFRSSPCSPLPRAGVVL